MTVQRIPESIVEGRRLGRHVNHDPRSLQYLVEPSDVSVGAAWTRRTPVLDQGNLGSCTGNAATGVLGTDPFYATLPGQALDEGEAVKLYGLATSLDPYPGTYPPTDTGSDGLSVAKACQQSKLISGYLHVTSVAAAKTAIQTGPFIVGSDWYQGFDSPASNGLVVISGSVRGGHEYECVSYDPSTDLWGFVNSWGTSFGVNGRFFYSSATFTSLLASGGDATTFVPVTQPAPTPTPVPTPADPLVTALRGQFPSGWLTAHHTGSNAKAASVVNAFLKAEGV